MIEIITAIISIILIIISYIPYFYGMFRGKVRPNAITWASWAITTAAMGIIQFFSGGGLVILPLALLVLINIGVFVLALKNGGRADIVKIDTICFAISILTFIFWLVFRQSAVAMILITISQFVAFVPTIRKVWIKPSEENSFTWGVNSLRYAVMIFTVSEFSVTTISNSIWWAGVYCSAAILILSRRKILGKKKDEK